METMEYIDNFDLKPRNIPNSGEFRRDIFENSGRELGYLSQSEAAAVVHFYGSIAHLQDQISEYHKIQRQKRELHEDRHAVNRQATSELDRVYSQIVLSFEQVKKHRRAALHLLSDNLN